MARDQVVYDIDAIAKAYNVNKTFIECLGDYSKTGIDRIRNCGISGGKQGKQIEEACDVLDNNVKLIIKDAEENVANIEQIMKNSEEFDMQDVIKKAAELSDAAKSTENVKVDSLA